MVHYFHSDIAQKYGINAAVLAAFIWDCIEGKSMKIVLSKMVECNAITQEEAEVILTDGK